MPFILVIEDNQCNEIFHLQSLGSLFTSKLVALAAMGSFLIGTWRACA